MGSSVLFVALVLVVSLGSCAIYNGTTAETKLGWTFTSKFVFDKDRSGGIVGSIQAFVRVPYSECESLSVDKCVKPICAVTDGKCAVKDVLTGGMLWLFSDEPTSWPAVYEADSPVQCKDAIKKTKNCGNDTTPCLHIGDRDEHKPAEVTIDGKKYLNFDFPVDYYEIKQNNQRYWFIAYANCDADGLPEGIEYGVHLLQVERGFWNREFGTNWMGLQTLFLLFFILYLPFVAVHFYGVYKLKQKLEFTHPMVQLFALIVAVQFLCIIFNMIHYLTYVTDGKGYTAMLEAGEIVGSVVRVLFVLLLILLAKGWAISGNALTQKFLIIGLSVGYLVLQVTIVLWKYAVADDAATSVAMGVQVMSVMLLAGWVGFGGFFLFTICKSYKNEDNPVKAQLYRNLGIVYGPWVAAVPITTILGLALHDFERARVLTIVEVCFNTVAYMVLSFLLWPSRAEEYFCISTPDVMTGAGIDTYEQL